ncbi:MAG TPA: transcriptional repressor [Desulfobulbaceae bacterium]|nr:transcriptional repressor [Desulfobulbaceae bacterium]
MIEHHRQHVLQAQFEQACREKGFKMTQQRLEIFRELAAASDHPAAETIHRRLLPKLPTLSLDTVYRTLSTFEHHGLITKVDTTESQARFEAAGEEHHHLICRKCGRITDFYWQRFDETALPPDIDRWGRVSKKNVTLYGICKECEESGGRR